MFEESGDWGVECRSSRDLHSVLFDIELKKTRRKSSPSTSNRPGCNKHLKSSPVVDHESGQRKAKKRKRKLGEQSCIPVAPVSDIVQPVGTGAGNKKESRLPVGMGAGNRKESRLPVGMGAGNRKESKLPVGTGAGNRKESRLPVGTEPSSTKECALRLKVKGKMDGARFRWINQQLYSTTGKEAKAMFADDPDLFQVYHQGFATQVSKWPVNPVDRVISYVQSLPSDQVIADFGCGEAKLSQSVPHTVHSFDLVAHTSHVTACDMAHVPLKKQSVDVCVFCLSLMSTNVSDFIMEARRVMVEDGRLKICEIVSRLPSVEEFVHGVEMLGFKHVATEMFSRMFVNLDFKAVNGRTGYKGKAPNLSLKPCNYKRR